MKKSGLNFEFDKNYLTQTSTEYERVFSQTLPVDDTTFDKKIELSRTIGNSPAKLNGNLTEFIEPLGVSILQKSIGNGKSKIIGLTSTKSGEGVSTIAASLAVMFSHRDGKVLFVDANLLNPSAHKLFGIQCSPGLADVVEDNVMFGSVVNTVHSNFLDVLTAGNMRRSLQSLASLSALKDLFDQIRQQYQYIILDLPSFENSHACCMAFSQYIDGMILLIECERTRVEAVKHTISILSQAQVNLLGVVLNKRQFYLPDWLYNLI